MRSHTGISVLIVDDEALVRQGLALLLGSEQDIEVVGLAGDAPTALELAQTLAPDVILLDVRMPDVDGLEVLRRMAYEERSGGDVTAVLMLTSFKDEEAISGALAHGASGFMLKSAAPRMLPEAVREVARGNAWLDPSITRQFIARWTSGVVSSAESAFECLKYLTPREVEILKLLAQGLGTSDLVARLSISDATVKTHISRVLIKLNLRDRAQAVAFAYQAGLVHP